MSIFYTNCLEYKNTIRVIGYNKGIKFKHEINYKPYLFIPSNGDTVYESINGIKTKKITFSSLYKARTFLKENKEVANSKIYGLTNFLYVYLYDTYKGNIKYDSNLINIVTIDIEVIGDERSGFPDIQKADIPIVAITLRSRNRNYVFGFYDFDTEDNNTYYIKCVDEHDLLQKFLQTWESLDPDVVTGWNINAFDIPYIINRIKLLFNLSEAKRLSSWHEIEEETRTFNNKTFQTYKLSGVSILDYYELYKKFTFGNQESYKLDFIASLELGEKKVDYSEYGSLHGLYKNNFKLFIEYNIHDVVLVDRLEEKLGFLQQVFALAYDSKINYNDTLTTVKPWDVIIHNYLLDKNIVVSPMPSKEGVGDGDRIAGGFVKEPIPGMYKWIVSIDLDSLYPHLIQQYNVSPDTFVKQYVSFPTVDELIKDLNTLDEFMYSNEFSYAANGTSYKKDKQGFLSVLMEKMYKDRVVYKKRMIELKKEYEKTKNEALKNEIAHCHNMQMAKKILLNSAYGAVANEWFRWFDNRLAEAITLSGQLSIKWIEKRLNEYLNSLLKTNDFDYSIALDTDSIYLNLEKVVKSIPNYETINEEEIVNKLDLFCEKKILPFIKEKYEELAKKMFAYSQKMYMKRENICSKGLWVAKKRYILNIWDSEGVRYSKPKIKVTGMETVRSSTPQYVKKKLKESFEIIMSKEENDVINFISETKKEFNTLSFNDISFPRGVNGISKYRDLNTIYSKGTPIQVRGALLYNFYLKKNKLEYKYPLINEGDKIKFCYLILPNPIHEDVIAILDDLPVEFGLNDYIDYEKQYNKTFLLPLKNILDSIGWKTEIKSNLENLFY